MYKIDGNSIINGEFKYSFEHEIRTVLEENDHYIILLAIPFNDDTLNNVFCLDPQLKLVWQVEDINKKYPGKNNLPYEQISINDKVINATDFYGRCYKIDVTNGLIVSKIIVK